MTNPVDGEPDGFDPDLRAAIAAIHESPTQAVVYVTGGASHALSWLQNVPGASQTILHCAIPYSRSAVHAVLSIPDIPPLKSYASPDAASRLARAAYYRAVTLAPPGARVVGIAAACALATADPHRSSRRAHVAAHDSTRSVHYTLTLAADAPRPVQDRHASRLLVQALADIALSPQSLDLSHESDLRLVRNALSPADILATPVISTFPPAPSAVINAHAQFAERFHQVWNIDAGLARLIFPGSFNPLHDGHRRLMAVARTRRPNLESAYELCVHNVDKPALDEQEVARRLRQFERSDGVILSRAGLFADKARLYPGACFVVGVDTALRIVMPKYYGNHAGLIRAMADLRARNITFLVAGRIEQTKEQKYSRSFQTMRDVPVPEGFEDMFDEIDESEFRLDISGSELRQRAKDTNNT